MNSAVFHILNVKLIFDKIIIVIFITNIDVIVLGDILDRTNLSDVNSVICLALISTKKQLC